MSSIRTEQKKEAKYCQSNTKITVKFCLLQTELNMISCPAQIQIDYAGKK